jgi:hypothetical protein
MQMLLNSLKLILPALIPSWRFFSSVAPSPRVEYALGRDANTPPENWHEFRPRPDHVPFTLMLRRMLWNPLWNETLFLVSCSERLIAAPTQHSAQEIRRRIARDLMRSTSPPTPTSILYFRLVFWDRVGSDLIKSIEYESDGTEISKDLRP